MNSKILCLAASSLASVLAGASVTSADGGAGTNEAFYGYDDFYSVPRLGRETVVGTGCGGDGSVGNTIPDGYWRGYVRGEASLATLDFDLVCVYNGDVDPDLIARWIQEHPGQQEPWVRDGFLVNDSARTRTVPMAAGAVNHGSEWAADGSCSFGQIVPFDGSRDAWIHIVDGEADFVVSSCGGPASVPGSQPGTGLSFPYAEFWDVPQLGSEPVHGTGCGGDGSLGDTIPDGFWYGWSSGVSAASLQFDVGCMYLGDVAEQLCAEFAAENPDDGSPPCWGVDADAQFLANNSTRTRTVPLAPTFVAADAEWVDNGNGTLSCVPTASRTDMNVGMGEWLYIENGQAQYSLRECGHD